MGAQCSCSDGADLHYDEVADLCEAAVHASEQSYSLIQDTSAIRAFSVLHSPSCSPATPPLEHQPEQLDEWQQKKLQQKVIRGDSRHDSACFEEKKSTSQSLEEEQGMEQPVVGRPRSHSRSTRQPEEEEEPIDLQPLDPEHLPEEPFVAPQPPIPPPAEEELPQTPLVAPQPPLEAEDLPVVLPVLLNTRLGWDGAGARLRPAPEPERFQASVRRESPDDYLGLDVKQVQGNCLQVVHVCPDGAAAQAEMLKKGDIIQRVNGVGGSCVRMVSECEAEANLIFDVFRPYRDSDDCGSSVVSVAQSHKGGRPTVPPLKLPLNTGSPHRPRRQSAPAACKPAAGKGHSLGFRASVAGALGRGTRK